MAFSQLSLAVLLTVVCDMTSPALMAQTAQPAKPAATPARDAPRTEKPGTATIKGRVLSADGRPLRRAQIRLTASALRDPRTVSTDTDGNYEVGELSEGIYTVRVTRSGYLSLTYGQKYPGELGKPVQVGNGETVADITVILPRAGIIAGRVMDEVGDPIAGVMVLAMQQKFFEGRRRVVLSGGSTRTDDTGQYRLIGLVPGEYYVLGSLRESWVVGGKDKTVLSFAPTYYPAATSLPLAQRVKVGIGQEVAGIDFALAIGRAAHVSGVALNASGGPLANGRVSLNQEFRGPGSMMMMGAASTTAAADGTWKLANVAPGEYKIEARPPDTGSQERATQTLVVDGVDLEGVTLATSAGGTIHGQVALDNDAGQSVELTRLRVISRPLEGGPTPAPVGSQNGAVDAQGKFELAGVIGAQRLSLQTIPEGWALKAIERDGQDITDATIQLRSGERVDDVRMVLTDRLTLVTGTVLTERAEASSSGTVVVFAEDASRWGEASRYVRGVRPTQTGGFEIKGLPPGDYRAIALEYMPEGDWNDPEVLQPLRDRAMRFSLEEGEKRSVSLQIKN